MTNDPCIHGDTPPDCDDCYGNASEFEREAVAMIGDRLPDHTKMTLRDRDLMKKTITAILQEAWERAYEQLDEYVPGAIPPAKE